MIQTITNDKKLLDAVFGGVAPLLIPAEMAAAAALAAALAALEAAKQNKGWTPPPPPFEPPETELPHPHEPEHDDDN